MRIQTGILERGLFVLYRNAAGKRAINSNVRVIVTLWVIVYGRLYQKTVVRDGI